MKAGKFLKYFVLLVVAGNLAIIAYVFLGAPAAKPIPMPNPNGYDDFVKAGPMLSGKILDYDKMDKPQLETLLSTNEAALKLIRTGLSRECRVPDDYSSNYVTALMPTLSGFKQSAFLLCAKGKLDQLNGHTNRAAEMYLDAVRFGQESSRGGVIISKLVGIACESIGLKSLESLYDGLDAKEAAKVARTLENIDFTAEPVEATLAQEKNFGRQTGSFMAQVAEMLYLQNFKTIKNKFAAKINSSGVYRRRVMVTFAVRAYELEKGNRPASLADLVPAYLRGIPRDPFTGTNITYSP